MEKMVYRLLNKFLLLIFATILFSCGGVIGNIKLYDFYVSKYTLDSTVKIVMNKYPKLKIPKGGKYTYENNYFSNKCYISDFWGDEVFSYKYSGDSLKWAEYPEQSRIALIAMSEYNEMLDFNRIFFPIKKWRMISKFENEFIDKIKEELKNKK